MSKKERYNVLYGKADRNFYRANKQMIDDLNYKTVKAAYLSVMAITLLLSAVTYLYEFLRYLTPFYSCFAVFFLLTGGFVFGPLKKHLRLTRYFYYLLVIGVYTIAIIAGTYFSPNDLAVTFFIVIVIAPMIYIEPPFYSFLQIAFACTAFGLTSYIIKSEDMIIVQYDIANALFGFLASSVFVAYIRNMHIENMKMNIKYREELELDKLTGVYNKERVQELCKEYLQKMDDESESVLLLVDMDNFKKINTTLGHTQGDLILKNVGEILRRVFLPEDIIGRLAGDEFLVLIKNGEDREAVHKKAEQVLNRIGSIFSNITKQTFSCSIGFSVISGESHQDYDTFILHTEHALNAAKKRGKNEIVSYEDMYESESNEPAVLVIDDIGINRALLSKCLDDTYVVLQAENEFAAIELMKKYEERVIACIINVETNNGNTAGLFEKIRKQTNSKKFVILAVTKRDINEYQLVSLGADGQISMPFDGKMITKTIDEAIKFRASL